RRSARSCCSPCALRARSSSSSRCTNHSGASCRSTANRCARLWRPWRRERRQEMGSSKACRLAFLRLLALSAWLCFGLPAPSLQAQGVPPTLRVETFSAPPFAMQQGGTWTGFTIELWEEVARRLNTKSVYRVAPGLVEAFDALKSGQADVLVSGFFITADR